MSAVENALTVLNLIADNSPTTLSKAVQLSQVEEAAKGLAALAPEEDEYLALDTLQRKLEEEVSKGRVNAVEGSRLYNAEQERVSLKHANEHLHTQVSDLTDELAALREVDATRQEIFTQRIDLLQQELHTLRQERTNLYEAAAGIEEAVATREAAVREMERLLVERNTVSAENDRLRRTNGALTQQLFSVTEAEKAKQRDQDGSALADDEVMEVLTGRREETADGLLRLLARLHKQMEDDRRGTEREKEVLHLRIRRLEMMDSSPSNRRTESPGSTAQIKSAVSSLGSSVVGLFQTATAPVVYPK